MSASTNDPGQSALVRHLAEAGRTVASVDVVGLDDAIETTLRRLVQRGLAARARGGALLPDGTMISGRAWSTDTRTHEQNRVVVEAWAKHLTALDPEGSRVVRAFDARDALPFQSADAVVTVAALTRPAFGVRCVFTLDLEGHHGGWDAPSYDALASFVDVVGLTVARAEAAAAADAIAEVLATRARATVSTSPPPATATGLAAYEDPAASRPSDAPTRMSVEVPASLLQAASTAPPPPARPAVHEAATRVDGWMDEIKLKLAIDEKLAQQAAMAPRPSRPAPAPVRAPRATEPPAAPPAPLPGRVMAVGVVVVFVLAFLYVAFGR